MFRQSLGMVAAVAVLALPTMALAQERGRTDGPEGSEYGKGGYGEPGGGMFSLSLSWGAALPSTPLSGNTAPLFVGAIGTFWLDDWFVFDVAPSYLFNSRRLNLLVGPRFRTMGYPIGAYIGLHAGAISIPDAGVRFALSPQLGVDMTFADHYLAGLGYAMDIPLGGPSTNHRIFMNVGYRF